MAADNDNPELGDAVTESQDGPGTRLRAARRQAGLTVDDVAHELRLEIAVVAAIEADRLDSLGAPVFVKGYLRSYARLLGLPEQELVDAWQPAETEPEDFRALSMQTEMRPGASLSNFVIWALLGLLALASLIYLMSGEDEEPVAQVAVPAAAGPAEPLPTPVGEADFVVEESGAAEFVVEEVIALPAAVEAEPEPVAVPQPAPEPEAPVQAETVEVQLSFDDECWVELSDSRRRLLYGLEKAGSVRSFAARPPLRFFVGNVDAVSISLAGNPYAIPRRVRTGRNTARFVLNADDIQGLQ